MPLWMKIVLMLPNQSVESMLEKTNIGLKASDVNGLFINIIFDNGELICTTGSSVKVFTLDKSLDNLWDEMAVEFLKSKNIALEEV